MRTVAAVMTLSKGRRAGPLALSSHSDRLASGQWSVVFLTQSGCGLHIDIGQVQLHATGTECQQLPGDFTAQAMGEGIRTDLSITPQQIDDFFHSDQAPRCDCWMKQPCRHVGKYGCHG